MHLVFLRTDSSGVGVQKWTISPTHLISNYYKDRIIKSIQLPVDDYHLSVSELVEKYGKPE
jgi:hypothetical protein